MSALPETIVLGAEDEARRLWAAAEEARSRAGDDLIALCEALEGLPELRAIVAGRQNPQGHPVVAALESDEAAAPGGHDGGLQRSFHRLGSRAGEDAARPVAGSAP